MTPLRRTLSNPLSNFASTATEESILSFHTMLQNTNIFLNISNELCTSLSRKLFFRTAKVNIYYDIEKYLAEYILAY